MTTRACRTRFPAAAVICLAAAACSSNQATPPIDAEAATASRPGVVVIDATAQQRAGVVIQPVRAVMATDRITAPGLIALDEAEFGRRFRHTPMMRSKRRGLIRNALIVLGNVGDARALRRIRDRLTDEEPLIREAAEWASTRIESRLQEDAGPAKLET